MKKVLFLIVSVLFWIWVLISSLLFTPLLCVLWLFSFWWDKNLRLLHLFSCFWGAQYIWVNPFWKLKIYDRKKYNNKSCYIVMSNHQSLVDIMIVNSLFRHFRWTSKEKNFKAPFVGLVLSFSKSIKVYRNDVKSFEKFKSQALLNIEEGNSIMVFPEGTRSKTGELGRFMDGAFKIALETKTDILPMVLDGSSKAIPKSGWTLSGYQKMSLKVLDPMPYEEWKDLSIPELKALVKEKIQNELNCLRQNDSSVTS